MEKIKMSNKKFRFILIPIVAVLAVLIVVFNILCAYWAQTFDWVLGRGEVQQSGGAEGVDAKYYEDKYTHDSTGKLQARDAAADVTEAICDEGIVLLKNDGALPLSEKEKVTPFGYRYISPIYGGVGSGRIEVEDYFSKLEPVMQEYFDVNATVVDEMKGSDEKYLTETGYETDDEDKGDYDGATTPIAEYDPSIYKSSDIGDYKTGIVFIGRNGGEGGDLKTTGYYDSTAHQLQLSRYEKQTIEFAKNNCDKVIVVLNTANALELGELEADPEINGIIWVANVGSRGFKSMAKILTGEVNPSGKLVDIYAADAKSSPAFANFGDFTYAGDDGIKYLEYEEGIYVGYRYYETADAVIEDYDYDAEVVYPFGYGLNYDDDKVTQELVSVTYDQEAGTVEVKGVITNTSERYDVKEVVQIYAAPPYYADGSGIEKAAKNLVAFGKYEVAKATQSSPETTEFTITFPAEELASYDYKGYYSENGSYVLEAGEYGIYLGKDSHNSWGSDTIEVSKTLVYADETTSADAEAVGKRDSDAVLAENKFNDVNSYMEATEDSHAAGYETDAYCTDLTRADFENTFPTANNGKTMPSAAHDVFTSWQINRDLSYKDRLEAKYGTTAPVSKADNGLKLSEFRGLDYDDPKWDKLLDQIDYGADDLKSLIGKAAYASGALASVGKPATTDVDGPQGLSKVGQCNAYQAEIILASTWNKDLARRMGEALGAEALTQTRVGWYAPSMNIHRTPFSGRNYEYYSEDPLLSGKMAAETVSGAATYGVVAYIKHFAVNDQELNRKAVCTWANEQTMREIYLRPFEICVKEAKATLKYLEHDEQNDTYTSATKEINATLGVMSSMNCIGALWASEHYVLLKDVLRGEWGFRGTVISDSMESGDFGTLDAAVQAGNDLWLWYTRNNFKDMTSPHMQWAIREAVHNICYSYANSLIMQDVAPGGTVTYGISTWQIIQIVVNIVLALAVAALIAWIVIRTLDEKKYPEKYSGTSSTQ